MVGNIFERQIYNRYFRDNKGNGAMFGHGSGRHVVGHACVRRVFGGNGNDGAALTTGAADVGFHGSYFLLNDRYGLKAPSGCTLLSNCGFENNHRRRADFAQGDAGIRLKVRAP